nr:glycoside hydrolase family 3 [Colletotrichum truncatum]KAF6786636.1 glycoside hydrolase family 3 [Colletotrichum truncatum]
MRYSPEMQIDHHVGSRNSPSLTQSASATLVRDRQDCIPLQKILLEDDIIVLLTPVVVPDNGHVKNESDPFEPLGRAIATRHSMVRHVPYTKRGGINNIHFEFIKRAKAIVFVISGPPIDGDVSQVELADVARSMANERPQILVACCNTQVYDVTAHDFATIVQVTGYIPSDLELAASIIFGDQRVSITNAVPVQNLIIAPQHWPAEVCGPDMTPIHQLWTECLPPRYHLPLYALVLLLRRDGYAMNYVVREPETRQIVGFCATYTTFTDSDQENLLGSLAILIVKTAYRGRGIGLSLHNFALKQLQRTRGVNRLQLGSTFPRLLYGVPSDFFAKEWFSRRGWQVNGKQPGQGLEASDWLLKFDDMPVTVLSSAGLSFRRCSFMDFHLALEIVDRDAVRKGNMGWYDQYARLDGTPHIEDIILGFEGETIVAVALTYIPNSGSPVDEDLPWAKSIGTDVGGVTCICITGTTTARW